MGKNKKGKVVSMPLSAEGYFKSGRARKLPIYECLINEGWEDSGMANILVSRIHSNGNLSWGMFLVDTYCLGVKECLYSFNLPQSEYEEQKEMAEGTFEFEPCDYPLAHNIIYGAMEFAEEFGFSPHKDFKIGQFILEEDDDAVELIDIEFGKDGKPFYVAGPYDDPAKQSRILATLARNAGTGNYGFGTAEDEDEDEMDEGDDEDFDDEEFDDDDFDDEEFDDEWNDEKDIFAYFSKGELPDILDEKQEPDYIQLFVLIQLQYNLSFKDKPSSIGITKPSDLDILNMMDGYLTEDVEYLPQNRDEMETLDRFIDSELPDPTQEEADALDKTLDQYPHLFELYMLRVWMDDAFGYKLKDDFGRKFSEKFPDTPFAKIISAYYLCSLHKFDEALKVFENEYKIQDIFPERDGEFSDWEVFYFMALMCKCYTAKRDIASAKIFAQSIVKFGDENELYTVLGLEDLLKYMIKTISEAKPNEQEQL